MQKISPCLWFDDQAEEAASFYVGIFRNSRIGNVTRYGEAGYDIHGRPAGSVMTVEFQLAGQEFLALNGGPIFTFNEAMSFIVNCPTQEELDHYWDKLSEGGDNKRNSAAGSKTNTGCPGRSSPRLCVRCCKTGMPRNHNG
jgi:predicted 3-demethylubiquinone-9 3-methyltransferase (glyoxalase superfamily)